MPLGLIVGPANAGKVALLLDRYLSVLDREPVLIVPHRSDVERVERELLRRSPCLLGGSIGTFDDLFRRIARDGGSALPVATEAQRALVVRRAVRAVSLDGLGASARFAGFADALAEALRELEGGLLEPADHSGRLAELHDGYRTELERIGLWDRDRERRYAAERVASELGAWDGRPVFAYGFEDLTAAQWLLLQALAGRAEVTVSLPYEPGRPAFASLERTAADLAALADGRVQALPPRYDEVAHPALAHLERALFSDAPRPAAPPVEGAVRWIEGAGTRATLELVAEEILQLLRAGLAPEDVLIVCPSVERWRAPLETAFSTMGVPYALEGRLRFGQTTYGHALLSLVRYCWTEPSRRTLFAFLRSPYSGLTRSHVDFLEGRLRGRAVRAERVEEEAVKLRGAPFPLVEAFRAAASPSAAVRDLAAAMLRSAYGVEAPPATERARADLRAYDALARLLDELEEWELSREDLLHALERAEIRPQRVQPGRVSVADLRDARTRTCDVAFVLGLEGGTLPRRDTPSPFLDEDARRALDERKGSRLLRADSVARDRYLFYTACTRASRRLVLVREAATDDGAPREASPFWDESRAVFDPKDVARWTRRRPLSQLTWPIEAAPSERERLRALSVLATSEPETATALALANGWERRLERALAAFERPTRLTHPDLLAELHGRGAFSVTELESFADCSSIWFVDRVLSPRRIDAEVDAKLRGQVAHSALFRFFSGLPKRLGADTVEPERLDEALAFLEECLQEALGGVGMDLTDLQRRELEGGLRRDLEAFVRAEAELDTPLVPRRFEVSFGTERSSLAGLDLGSFKLSGKIDRIDVDPFSARGIVQDYKSGSTAHSASRIESELRLQIPLYMLVLRDLIGIEPLGGVYRALSGKREARGLLRAEDGVPGYQKSDYLPEDEFWRQVELARERAAGLVERMRGGDVRHDPRFGSCPDWCELWSMCRVKRA